MVRVRRFGAETVELISLEEQGVRRHHLQLLLFSARLAALRGDEAEYRTSLDRAGSWLGEMFDTRDAGVTSLQRELRALEHLPIAVPVPDISQSLKLLEKVVPRSTGGA
jgi:uroporphyrin-3 C-methyltransferase